MFTSRRFIFRRSIFQFPLRDLAHVTQVLVAVSSTHQVQGSCRTMNMCGEAVMSWGRNGVLEMLTIARMIKKYPDF